MACLKTSLEVKEDQMTTTKTFPKTFLGAFLIAAILLSMTMHGIAFAAAVETRTGKKIPARIIEEGSDQYKMETDLPGGGKIIFNVNKDKVDPHGAVPGQGRIEDITGTAEIKKAGRTFYSAARIGMSVYPGDEIRTNATSKVIIILEKAAITSIGPNSKLVIEDVQKNNETRMVKIKIGLPRGELWSEVGRLKTKNSNFTVSTPTAVTGVRGTVFRIQVESESKETSIAVLAGKVGVSSLKIPGKEIVLGKREALFVQLGKEPRRFDSTTLAEKIADALKKWTIESKYFKSVTALAGIGQMEEIFIEPTLPENQKQKVYDAIQAGWEKASEDLFQIDKALKMFYLDFGRFPTPGEGGLNALAAGTGSPEWNGPYVESEFLVDHYGVRYGYRVVRDIAGKVSAEITTFGYDKKPGTADDRRKMVSEQDARRWQDRRNYR